MTSAARELGSWPLFHWSPARSRGGISRRGLRTGMLSLDRTWRPPYVAFAEDPRSGWELSGALYPELGPAWDLWQVESGDLGDAEALFTWDGEQHIVAEWRVYKPVPARLVWLVATRGVYDDLISATEAAVILGVTRQRVQQLAAEGALPARKVGKALVFSRTVVQERRASS